MADYASANLVKAQTILTQRFNADEKRFRVPVTFLEFLLQTEIMVPSHKEVRTREDRAVESNFKLRNARALGTGGRVHNHTGTRGDSDTLTHTWIPYDDKFKWSLKQADANVYSLEEQLANELDTIIANFAEGLETVATSFLFSNRTGVNGYASQGSFNGVDDVFEITETTEGDRAIQITKTVLDFNKYQGVTPIIFADTISFDKFEKQANQGSGNSENLSFQFSGIKFVKSIELDALAAALGGGFTNGFWVAVPMGSIAVLDWIPKQNREGINTKENRYGTLINPVDGLSYATHEYEERSDESGSNGSPQDVKTEVEVSVDLSFESAPVPSDGAGASSMFACALV